MPRRISLADLADKVREGHTFTPAQFNPAVRSNANWCRQQLFVLDFDGELSFGQVLERCNQYRIMLSLAYSTFSSVNDERFRLVFALGTEINDVRLRAIIQESLFRIFPEADQHCGDAGRMFFGGKDILHFDDKAKVEPPDLIVSMCLYLTENDKHGHFARTIKRFCRRVGLDLYEGLPKVLPDDHDGIGDEQSGSASGRFNRSTCIYYRTCGDNARSYYFFLTNCNSDDGSTTESEFRHPSPAREGIRDFDFEKLEETCQLYRDFSRGEVWLYHADLVGLAINLVNIEGGLTKFLEGLGLRQEYKDTGKLSKLRYYAKYFKQMNYRPARCDTFCPYHEQCKHADNMIQQVRIEKGQIVCFAEPNKRSLYEAEDRLREEVRSFRQTSTPILQIIKAPTGIGKSQAILGLESVMIAAPTHSLKEELVARIRREGNQAVLATPELPTVNPTIDALILGLYQRGCPREVNKKIKGLAETYDLPELSAYLKELDAVETFEGTVVTTHERLLGLRQFHADTVIIDEDPLETLLPNKEMSLQDFGRIIPDVKDRYLNSKLMDIYRRLHDQQCEVVMRAPSLNWNEIEKIEEVVINQKNITSNVLGFLSATYCIKGDNGHISYIGRRELPVGKKILIMSATIDEFIYSRLFPELKFVDVGHVETKGQLIQYPQRSFSRTSMEKDPSRVRLATVLSDSAPIITYKSFKDHFSSEQVAETFGAIRGLDSLKGQDIVVIGTPHVNQTRYLLLAAALDLFHADGPVEMKYQMIEHNGFRFWFQTFEDEHLRRIQLALIEAELVQAAGRARILRKDCTVTVLSNYPLVGAEFRYMTSAEMDSLQAT